MACKFTCIQPCCYFFIVRTHVTELEQSGNEVALRTRYIQRECPRPGACEACAGSRRMIFVYSIISKYSLKYFASPLVYVDSVISCILFSTKCKSGLTGQEFCGKTHSVGVDREKQARKPKLEANRKDTEMNLGVRERN